MIGADLLRGGGPLYERPAQLAEQLRLVHGMYRLAGQQGLLPFVSPPYVAYLLLPFAALGFTVGGLLWLGVQMASLAAGLAAAAEPSRAGAWLLALISPPTFYLVANAQIDGLVVLGIGTAWRLHRHGLRFASGAALGLVLLKPHLAPLLGAGLLISRRWRVLAGWATAGAVLLVPVIAARPDLPGQWLTYSLASAGHNGHEFNLAGVVYLVAGGSLPVTVAAGLVAGMLVIEQARRVNADRVRAAILLTGGLLVAPHLSISDLVLVPLAVLIAGHRRQVAYLVAVAAASLGPVLITDSLARAWAGTAFLIAVPVWLAWSERLDVSPGLQPAPIAAGGT